jgi:hypothetical protein
MVMVTVHQGKEGTIKKENPDRGTVMMIKEN